MSTMSSNPPITVAPPPPGQDINLVDPEYIGYHLVICSIVLAVLSTIFLCMRLFTRRFVVLSLGWDDWWISCAWASAIALTITDCIETRYGAGIHIWNVTIHNFTIFLKLELVLGASYICALGFAKVSICCFYLRLSPYRTFRILVYVVIGFTAAYSFAGLLVVIFSCVPIAGSWDPATAARPTTFCINRPADYLAQAALNILTDISLFLLPLRAIWRMQLPLRQKMSVSSILAIGLLVCIISVVRLRSVVTVLNSLDLTWEINNLLIWSTIEAHLAIVCICMATLKPFLNRFFPRLLGKTVAQSGLYPTLTRQSTKLNASYGADAESCKLPNYREKAEAGKHCVIVTTNPRNSKYGDVDINSQESIIRGMEEGIDRSEAVCVTRTVDVSLDGN